LESSFEGNDENLYGSVALTSLSYLCAIHYSSFIQNALGKSGDSKRKFEKQNVEEKKRELKEKRVKDLEIINSTLSGIVSGRMPLKSLEKLMLSPLIHPHTLLENSIAKKYQNMQSFTSSSYSSNLCCNFLPSILNVFVCSFATPANVPSFFNIFQRAVKRNNCGALQLFDHILLPLFPVFSNVDSFKTVLHSTISEVITSILTLPLSDLSSSSLSSSFFSSPTSTSLASPTSPVDVCYLFASVLGKLLLAAVYTKCVDGDLDIFTLVTNAITKGVLS
jgi:hypothetical protein